MGPDMIQVAVDLTRRALVLSLELSLPVLLVGMVVGFLVSLLQAVTQIQEQTLSFIPKILAVAATVFLTLPWMLNVLVDYTREVLLGMRTVLVP
jgi:flagellar biosynthetic protein FliQ